MEENFNIENNSSCIPEKAKKKCCCNTCLLICNIVLLIGLVGIYILHFTGIGTKSLVNPNAKPPVAVAEGGLKVAYINTDSLIAKYQYAIDLDQELKTYQTNKENDFAAKTQKLQNDFQEYLRTGDKMTLSQQKAKEEELKRREAELGELQMRYAQQVQEKTLSESEKMTNAVYNFIRDYNESNQNYDIILARSFTSSPVLYGNPGMDITDEILEGLNKEYESVKGK